MLRHEKRRKKGYNKVEIVDIITEDQFEALLNGSEIPSEEIKAEITEKVKDEYKEIF